MLKRLVHPRTLILLAIILLLIFWRPFADDPESALPTSEPPLPTMSGTVPPSQPSAESDAPIAGPEAVELMYRISHGDDPQGAIDRVVSAGDTRFVAVFIELMRANEIGLLEGAGYSAHVEALEALSGQPFGGDWYTWVEWYGGTDLTPPPGFTGWKGYVLSGIDPRFADLLRDEHASTIRVEEIQWGGVVMDGIPALRNPAMTPADQALYLTPQEPVFGISINGDHRAYPLRIMDWHEMANDVVGGVPISLAYCTLCGAGIAFDGRASDEETYTFGSSGFLFRSNKLMYDHQTLTLWNQITGEPVLGELAGSDIRLDLLPVVVTSWEAWLEQHPDTKVLDIDTGFPRNYEPGAAYGAYFASDETMFPVWQRSQLLETKERVYALRVEDIPKAYPLEVLMREQVVNDAIGETSIVVIASRGDITVQAFGGQAEYNAGGEVRAYVRQGETFTPGPDTATVLDSEGNSWQVTEEALVGPNGELAPRLNGHLAYWFGWYTFFPGTLVYGE